MRILVTGAAGFLGSHVGRRLAERHDVLGILFRSAQSPSFECRPVDLTDGEALRSLLSTFVPQVIVHAAAMSRVIDCDDRPDEAREINVKATARLAAWTARAHAKLIFISSDQVFSGERGSYRESDPTGPMGNYGRTKLEAEQEVLASGARALILRSNSIVGASKGFGESFSDRVLAALKHGRSIDLFEDQFRSPIHVRDMVDVIETGGVSDFTGLLHVGGTRRMTRLDTGYAVARAYGLSPDLIRAVSYKTHPRSSIMTRDTSYDVSRLKQVMPAVGLHLLEEQFALDAKEAA